MSSEIKHTPGPWTRGITLRTRQTATWAPEEIAENNKIERRNVFSDFSAADEGRGRFLVAACQRGEDARLIAAAPELLAALEWAVSKLDCEPSGLFYSDDTKAHEAAIAAIDKARGRE